MQNNEKKIFLLISIIFLLLGLYCKGKTQKKEPLFYDKKVFYIDSYHEEYKPGIDQRKTFSDILKNYGVKIKTAFLDAKNISDEKILKNNAAKIANEIENYTPDIVIASDDDANKFVVVPYLKNKNLPIIFIGVNWDASKYGYPTENITGQIEVELIENLIALLKSYSKGDKIGLITANTTTDKIALDYYINKIGLKFKEIYLVDYFNEWKEKYIKLQDQVDLIIFRNMTGIKNWNNEEALDFIYKNSKKPSGTASSHMQQFVLITVAKNNKEFGEYAAETVIEILKGRKIADMQLSKNKNARRYLNMKLAKKLNIKFDLSLIESSNIVE